MSKFRILRDGKLQHEIECAPIDLDYRVTDWLHKNNWGCSADWSLRHDGYSVVNESGKRVDWVAQQVKGASNE
jgi:hypothetical protein